MKLQQGKIAFITGGANGIGAAAARMLAEYGVQVVSFDRDDAANQKLAAQSSLIHAVSCDCTDYSQIRGCFQFAVEKLGGVDILINNAGDFVFSSFLKDSYPEGLQGLEHMLRLFVGSTYAFTLLAAPILAARQGAVINVLTNHVHRDICRVSPEEHSYDAAKYAQMSLNMSMAAELHPMGVRVNAVDPAATYTKMLTDFFTAKGMPATVESIAKTTRVGSLMLPEDVALAICNLIGWEDPAPVGQNYLLRSQEDCIRLKHPPQEVSCEKSHDTI